MQSLIAYSFASQEISQTTLAKPKILTHVVSQCSWQPEQDPYHGPYTETEYGEYSWDYLTPDYAKYWWPDRKPPQTPPSKNPPPAQGRSSFFDEDDFEDFEDSFDSEDVSDAPKKIRRKRECSLNTQYNGSLQT